MSWSYLWVIDLTPEQMLEISRYVEGSLVRDYMLGVEYFNMTGKQVCAFLELIMIKDPTQMCFLATDFNFNKISQDKVLDLALTGIAHHPTVEVENFNLDRLDEGHLQDAFQKHPELLLFTTPKIDSVPRLRFPSFNRIQEKIEGKEKDRATLFKWLGYMEIARKHFGISDMGTAGDAVLDRLIDLRAPTLRYKISRCLFDVLGAVHLRSCLESESIKKMFSGKFSSLFQLLLTPLLAEDAGSLIEVVSSLNSKYYEDSGRAKIVMSSLLALGSCSLTNQEKTRLLKVAFAEEAGKKIQEEENVLQQETKDASSLSNKADRKAAQTKVELKLAEINIKKKALCNSVIENLQSLEFLINVNSVERLKEVKEARDFPTALQGVFTQAVGIGEIEGLAEKITRTFAQARNPLALFIYAGKLKQLHEEELTSMLSALKLFAEAILNGTLSALRYQDVPGDHLSVVFAGREDLKREWIQGDRRDFSGFISPAVEGSSREQFDVHAFLYNRVCVDRHVPSGDFVYLEACLRDGSKLVEQGKALLEAIKAEKDPEKLNSLRLQKGLLLLLDPNKKEEDRKRIFVSQLKLIDSVFPRGGQFKQDLLDLGGFLCAKKSDEKSSYEGWTVEDTDDWQDMLMCGTEIDGSCQNINGDCSMNKCLLGYALDGKNRLIVVKNEKGEIVARSVMRLLWDEKAKTPVLFKEREYLRQGMHSQVSRALDQMFLARSLALKIPLIQQYSRSQSTYPNPVVSLSARENPFEYVDAEGTGVTKGRYTLTSTSFVEST